MFLGKYRSLVAVLCTAPLWLPSASISVNAASAVPAQILIKDFMFMPTTLTVKANTTVIWANKDDEPHTVVSDSGLFKSSAVDTDETFTYKFDKPGTYHFTCSIHPRMVGVIVVE